MLVNVNSYATVKLTNEACKVWDNAEYVHEKVANDGTLKAQIWVLMRVFGPSLSMGTDPPFVNNEMDIDAAPLF